MADDNDEKKKNDGDSACDDCTDCTDCTGGGCVLGPTGDFPDGKMGKHDEGGLQLTIGHNDGKVIIAFGIPVSWVGVNPKEAREMAQLIVRHANEAELEMMPTAGGLPV